MGRAIKAERDDSMPFATAAKTFNVPWNTLKRQTLGKNIDAIENKQLLGKYRPIFNEAQKK